MAKLVVPEARKALDKFKMEAANEVGVNLKEGYNGDLTSKQAGSVGGQMVNIISTKCNTLERVHRNAASHRQEYGFVVHNCL